MTWITGLIALVSLLAVFKAPAKPLWFVAIVATEWGHWLALFSIFLALISWRATHRWGAASWFALAAAVLFITPLVRATVVARDLPGDLIARFGPTFPRAVLKGPARSKPLDLMEIFRGIASPDVRVSNVEYAAKDGKPLTLDLYQPLTFQSGSGLPGIIVVHSGSWQSGDRGEFPPLNRYLAARGYVVASIDYRLAPGAIFPAQRDDVFSAIGYLKSHAKAIGLDETQLVLVGRSAGGQIALSAAYAEKEPAIKGVIVYYTPNDLAWGYTVPGNPLIMNSQKVIETYLGGSPDQIPGVYDAASPLHQVNGKTPPTLMIHGLRDELVWALHEERLSKRLSEAGRPYYYLRLPWATHGCDANFQGPSGQLATYAVERFLAAVLPPDHRDKVVKKRSPAHVRQNQPA